MALTARASAEMYLMFIVSADQGGHKKREGAAWADLGNKDCWELAYANEYPLLVVPRSNTFLFCYVLLVTLSHFFDSSKQRKCHTRQGKLLVKNL